MEYEILQGSLSDIEKIVKLNYGIFSGMYESEPYSLEQYNSRLQGKSPLINIAKVQDEIIANTIAFRKEDSLYLWIMGVSSKHRNKKIASRLLDSLERSARAQGFTSVTTKVYPVSKEMQQLMRHRGYKVTKTDDHEAIHFKLNLV